MEHVATEAPAVRWAKYMGGPEAVLEVVRVRASDSNAAGTVAEALGDVIYLATEAIESPPGLGAGEVRDPARLDAARVRALATLRELVTA